MQDIKHWGLKDLKSHTGIKLTERQAAHQYLYGVLVMQNTQNSHYLNYPLNQGHFLG